LVSYVGNINIRLYLVIGAEGDTTLCVAGSVSSKNHVCRVHVGKLFVDRMGSIHMDHFDDFTGRLLLDVESIEDRQTR
jgi:hypothetical protein